jgi:aminoglycoside/choline kinase family phosphotransferase
MQKNIEEKLIRIYSDWAGSSPAGIRPFAAHGSDRKYFRVFNESQNSIIAAYNNDKAENKAFITLSQHFHAMDLPVPELYHSNMEENIYFIQDLGDQTLFAFITEQRENHGFSDKIIAMYEQAVSLLPRFQIDGRKGLDFAICYPRHSFDKQSMLWDLNYFKYYFLKPAKITFNEQQLEDDFHRFCDYLLQVPCDFFLYRDCQSRNIMINDNTLYFIDYQGGRKGPLQYDIASLLYDAKADIPQDIRDILLEKYIATVSEHISIQRSAFMEHYHGYVLIRIMQALGAYGFRGFYERKVQFLQSVPYAIRNLEYILHVNNIPADIDELRHVWQQLIHSTHLQKIASIPKRLTITIMSFSYKNGLPLDDSEHGGGFVFDCRALPNPGRYPEYKNLTGKDSAVIEFLKNAVEVERFLRYIYRILDQVIANYQERNFTSLMVSFGCTGGQHRSVYCATQIASYIKKKYPVDIRCQHRELGQG